jgi:DnaJ-domain-containing protein 1
MSLTEAAVVLFGLFAGYWVISKLFFRSSDPRIARPASVSSPAPAWHEILQVSPDASAVDIRAAYKHLLSQYHPDKVDALGQELKELAVRKSADITSAYRDGMRARGEAP